MQHVTPGIGPAFQPVEDELCDAFLPAYFKGGTYHIPRRLVTGLPVKQAWIALPGHFLHSKEGVTQGYSLYII